MPGLLTVEGVKRIERHGGGTDSAFYISRVLGEFPKDGAEDALIRSEWVEVARERWAMREPLEPLVIGVDPAHLGHSPDATAICIRDRGLVHPLITWKNLDAEQTVHRITALVHERLRSGAKVARVVVDSIGLGGPILDRLKTTLSDAGWWETKESRLYGRQKVRVRVQVAGFDVRKRAPNADRFADGRSQAFWHIRGLLEDGRIGLPDDDELAEELLGLRVGYTADGKTKLEPKADLAARIGRSPDRADALACSFAPALESDRPKAAFR